MSAAAIIAWQHHERWDGNGYPRGLAGENIHRSARIVAIADVFDALASDRPWRKAWSTENIAGHVEAEAGRHFDPDLARIFLDNFDQFTELRGALPGDSIPLPDPGC
jgi:putative two-component system response regulator